MTNINESRDLSPLEQHLVALRSELHETIKRTQARRRSMLIGLIVIIVIIAAYWIFLYTKLAHIDSDYVADLAYGQVEAYVNKSPDFLNTQLRERAPEVLDYAEAQALRSPAFGAALVRDTILDKTKAILDDAQPRLDQAVDDAIAKAKAANPSIPFDGKDPAQTDRFIDALALQVHVDGQKTFDKVYADYDRQAQDLVSGIQNLALGKNLDALQEHHRQVIISFLALNEKWKTNPPELMSSSAADAASPIKVTDPPTPTPGGE